MGLFDTIEIEKDIPNGPESGEYQTKDLDCIMDQYVIENKRILKKIFKYHPVPKSEQKHLFHIVNSEFMGLLDVQYHGVIEMYGAYDTWKLKFTDGELKECKLTESLPKPEENKEEQQSSHAYWSGDGYEYELDEEEEQGY